MTKAGILRDSTSSAPDVETLTGNSGGAVGPDAAFNINLIGSGSVSVAGNPGTNTLTISVSGSGLSWSVVLGATQTMTSNNGYIANNVAGVTFTLPATSAVGDYIAIIGMGAGGWSIAQGAGQQVRVGANASTVGAAGTTTSSNQYDSLELICVVANTLWFALGGPESAGLTFA